MSAERLIERQLMRQSAADLETAAARAADRPLRAVALDVDLHSALYRGRLISEARFAVVRFEWTGMRWRRARRLSGPMPLDRALDELPQYSKRLGFPILGTQ